MLLFPMVHFLTGLSCGKPPSVRKAQPQYQSTNFGAVVTYVCNTGYTLSGASQRTCRGTGKWDDVGPKCCKFFFLWCEFLSTRRLNEQKNLRPFRPVLSFDFLTCSRVRGRLIKFIDKSSFFSVVVALKYTRINSGKFKIAAYSK